jgi:hypothetical protein
MEKSSNGFPQRKQEDGTFDSICPICFGTIATSGDLASLEREERNHVCEDLDLAFFLSTKLWIQQTNRRLTGFTGPGLCADVTIQLKELKAEAGSQVSIRNPSKSELGIVSWKRRRPYGEPLSEMTLSTHPESPSCSGYEPTANSRSYSRSHRDGRVARSKGEY